MDLEIICTPRTLALAGLGFAILCGVVIFLISQGLKISKNDTAIFGLAVVGCVCGFLLFIHEGDKDKDFRAQKELVGINQSITDFQESTNKDPNYLDKNAKLLIERTTKETDKQITTSIYLKDFSKNYNYVNLYVVRKETNSPEGEKVEYTTYRRNTGEIPQEIANLTKRLEQKNE